MIRSDVQQFEVDDIIELFELYIPATNSTQYFCSSAIFQDNISYASGLDGTNNPHVYVPIPIEASGYDHSGRGTLPQPKVKVADITGTIASLARQYNDLLGCKFTRIKTLKKYLVDPTIRFEDEVYYVSRKSGQNGIFTEFTLSSALDLQGLQLPRKLILKNYCSFVYRRWNSNIGDFEAGTCPYAGDLYFDTSGTVCAQDEDKCGKKLSDCKLRYPGVDDVLPTTAFPGVYDVRA